LDVRPVNSGVMLLLFGYGRVRINVMRVIMQTAVTLVALLLGANIASACSCVPAPSPDKAFRSVPSVFIGTVTKITPAERAIAVMPLSGDGAGKWEQMVESVWIVSLNIQDTFKGVRNSTIELVTNSDSAACGYDFEVGQSYLVYAYERADAGQRYAGEGLSRKLIQSVDNFNRGLSLMETSYCTRTANVKDADGEINQIRKLSKRQKPNGRRRSRNIG